MLKKRYRLKSKAAFAATYRVKNSTHKGGVTLFAGINKKTPNERSEGGCGVIKKTQERAGQRNRLRRLMRESYRLLLKSGELGNSQKYMSLIFIGGENALDKNFAQMQNIIKTLLERL